MSKKIFSVGKHYDSGRLVLAVCDSDILGSVFSDDNFILDLSKSFFKGELVDSDELSLLMSRAYIMNIAGEKSISLALRLGFISEEFVNKIRGVPFAFYVNDSFK